MASQHGERRAVRRRPGYAVAKVVRDSDRMRLGIPGKLLDVSACGIRVELSESLPRGERITVELENPLQRFKAHVRGTVVHVQPAEGDRYAIGLSLINRLPPYAVNLLSKHAMAPARAT